MGGIKRRSNLSRRAQGRRARNLLPVAEYQAQHYVPSSYLQHFAIDGKVEGRASKVWASDGDITFTATVKKIAVSDFTYSRSDPEGAEKSFQEMEGGWPRLVLEVTKQPSVSKRNQLLLLLHHLEIHMRSPIYEIPQDEERINLYRKWSDFYLNNEFGAGQDVSGYQEFTDQLASRWSSAVISVPNDDLMTSDNPSLFMGGETGRLDYLLLPISPSYLAITYRNEGVRLLTSQMTTEDTSRLCGLLAARCRRFMYSAQRFDPESIEAIGRLRGNHEWDSIFMTEDSMRLAINLDYRPAPSFIELL